jgi:hypothetical protein
MGNLKKGSNYPHIFGGLFRVFFEKKVPKIVYSGSPEKFNTEKKMVGNFFQKSNVSFIIPQGQRWLIKPGGPVPSKNF